MQLLIRNHFEPDAIEEKAPFLANSLVDAGISAGLFLAMPALPQFRTSIQGTVTDSTGAVIPGATLTLKNLATNETVVRTSN